MPIIESGLAGWPTCKWIGVRQCTEKKVVAVATFLNYNFNNSFESKFDVAAKNLAFRKTSLCSCYCCPLFFLPCIVNNFWTFLLFKIDKRTVIVNV